MVTGEREQTIATLRRRVGRWLDEFGLSEALAGAVKTSTAWASVCSPPTASADDQLLAALDLTLWLFSIDDDDGPRLSETLAQCVAQLQGQRDTSAQPLTAARQRLLGVLEERGPSLEDYRGSRVRYVGAIERRQQFDPSTASFEDYLSLRETTIYVQQWVELWGILAGLDLHGDRSQAPSLADALRSVVRWNIFDNETRSLSRDRARGTPNLVDLWCREHGLDDEEAGVAELHRLRHRASVDYEDCMRPLRLRSELAVHLSVLDACIDEKARVVSAVPERYVEPSASA